MSETPNQPAKPSNYLALAIICTVCCCLPAGIVSIVYAARVNEAYARGDYEMALSHSKNARTWGLVGLIAGAVFLILYMVALFGFGFMSEYWDYGGY